jgi:hypothetical protein
MSFSFDELLQQGKGAAENVLKNRREIEEVLDDLKDSLTKFLDLEIEFEERIEYVRDGRDPFTGASSIFTQKEKTGFNVVYIKSKSVTVEKEIFKLKRSDDVYPITVAKERNHLVSDEQSEFANAVGQIVSNSQFHLHLNSFKRQVEGKLNEQQLLVPKSE